MSNSQYPKSVSKIEAAGVKARLTDPRAFAIGLGLLSADAPTKKAYTVRCPYCGKQTLSIWWPGATKTVIGTCRRGCVENGNKTYPPLDLVGKINGLSVGGADFQRVLLIADQIGRGATASTDTIASPPSQASVPAATSSSEEEKEDADDPIRLRLHPDRTPQEWAYITSLGLDPFELRDRDWLGVLPDDEDQPARLKQHLHEGYTVWLTTYGPDGNVASSCAIHPVTGEVRAFPVRTDALANEFAQEVLAYGPDDLSTWPKADRKRPILYVVLGPRDFIVAESIVQRRLLPLLGVVEDRLPDAILARVPDRCDIHVLHVAPATRRHYDLIVQLRTAGRTAILVPLASADAASGTDAADPPFPLASDVDAAIRVN